MKIFDENQRPVGELNKPGPRLHRRYWWEATEYRFPEHGEYFLDNDQNILQATPFIEHDTSWIMSPVPTPTNYQLDQLKADGLRKRTGESTPMACEVGDYVWGKNGFEFGGTESCSKGSFRWRFETIPNKQPAPVIYTSCEGCGKLGKSFDCINACIDKKTFERKNYTVRPHPLSVERNPCNTCFPSHMIQCEECDTSFCNHTVKQQNYKSAAQKNIQEQERFENNHPDCTAHTSPIIENWECYECVYSCRLEIDCSQLCQIKVFQCPCNSINKAKWYPIGAWLKVAPTRRKK